MHKIPDAHTRKCLQLKQARHCGGECICYFNHGINHHAACNCYTIPTGRLYTLLFKNRLITKKPYLQANMAF